MSRLRGYIADAPEISAGLATGYLLSGLLDDALITAAISLRFGRTNPEFFCSAIDVLLDVRLLHAAGLDQLTANLRLGFNVPDIAMVELHDAQISDLTIAHGGAVTLHFAHVGVYERKGDDLYDLVSYSAALNSSEVTDLHIEGVTSADGWVSGLFLNGKELAATDETALISEAAIVSRAELTCFGGFRITATCKLISLRLGVRGDVIEPWQGPL